jgi:hypothetical protein
LTRPARDWGAENWADMLPSVLGFKAPPVDLYAVARHRRIRYIGFRFIIPRGLMVPVAGGFEVYLRDQLRRDVDISQEEPRRDLSVRHRFSLAHEIAHTRFYRFSDPVPFPDDATPNWRKLEDDCDRMAGCILVPTYLLKQKIRDYRKEIDSDFVRSIASDFRTSVDVALERLRVVEAANSFERCILLARRIHGDAEIQSLFFGLGLSPVLPRPEKYSRLSVWLPNFPQHALSQRSDSGSFATRWGRKIAFTTTDLGVGDRFLLELKAA